MKIEWLNADCTEAIVIKGWWRKVQARIRRISAEEWHRQSGTCWWRFVPSDREFGDWSLVELWRREELDCRRGIDWQPVSPMPRARAVKT